MNSDEKLFSGKYGKQKDAETADDADSGLSDDCVESPLGDGRNCNQYAPACLITDNDKQTWTVERQSVMLGVGPYQGRTYSFKFYAGEDVFEVKVEGPQIWWAVGIYALGRRATWHPFGAGTKSITVRKVEQPKGESGD